MGQLSNSAVSAIQSVQQAAVSTEVTKSLTGSAVVQTSESVLQSVQQPAVLTEVTKALPVTVNPFESWMSTTNPPIGILLGILLLPLSYFAFSTFVEFVNNRYDEISFEREGG